MNKTELIEAIATRSNTTKAQTTAMLNGLLEVIQETMASGSDVQLVAPLEVGSDTTIGAGSVITKDVPDGALAVTRATQVIKENYKPKR